MSILDFGKATVLCGGGAFLVYCFPVLSQVLLIGMIGLVWLVYARGTLGRLRRK